MASSDSLSHFGKESSQESCAQLLAWFSTSCCQHQFWRLPCWQKKVCCPKTSRTKVFASVPSCDHWSSGAFCHNILWEEKSCLWKLHGGATRKSTFCEFFLAIQICCQHFQTHAIRFGTFHKCYETQIIYMGRGLGWYLINEVMICQKWPKILKHFSVLKFWNTSVY